MAAKLDDQAGLAFRDQIQRVAQVEFRNGTARTADFTVLVPGECHRRPEIFFLDAGRQNADDALMPVFGQDADGRTVFRMDFRDLFTGFHPHVGFDFTPLDVDPVQFVRHFERLSPVVRDQAFDAKGHVGQASGGIEPGTECKTQIERGGFAEIPARYLKKGCHAGLHVTGTDASEALCNQYPVVGIEFDDVGKSAECDEIKQLIEMRLCFFIEYLAAAHFGTQGQQHVKHDADTGQIFARERAAGLVRIDDNAVLREFVSG